MSDTLPPLITEPTRITVSNNSASGGTAVGATKGLGEPPGGACEALRGIVLFIGFGLKATRFPPVSLKTRQAEPLCFTPLTSLLFVSRTKRTLIAIAPAQVRRLRLVPLFALRIEMQASDIIFTPSLPTCHKHTDAHGPTARSFFSQTGRRW